MEDQGRQFLGLKLCHSFRVSHNIMGLHFKKKWE